ncbi:MAG: hypothetical protein DYG94_03695 [Leptolyngbya sp. PLA3]|nr:MAG: hypothetical protein EDM82_08845 [Cyanobacteria bacterium CYA]MCE7967832.1 hypothetical protein [Leptolyngbya sp. PL-A3]
MSTRDLIELAALDALGMLEPKDQAEFERAFREAPASVRAQLRAEQARIADLFQVDAEPSPDLRDRVVAAVSAAVEAEVLGGSRAVVHHPGRVVPKVSRIRRVSPLWRAAAIGLSVAVVVLGVVANQLQQKNQQLGDQVIVSDYFNVVGTRYLADTLFNESTQRTIFQPVATRPGSGSIAQAVLLSDPDWKKSRFICQGLTVGGRPGNFQLCEVDENNKVVRSLQRFESGGRFVSFDLETPVEQGTRLAIFVDSGAGALGEMIMIAQKLG